MHSNKELAPLLHLSNYCKGKLMKHQLTSPTIYFQVLKMIISFSFLTV